MHELQILRNRTERSSWSSEESEDLYPLDVGYIPPEKMIVSAYSHYDHNTNDEDELFPDEEQLFEIGGDTDGGTDSDSENVFSETASVDALQRKSDFDNRDVHSATRTLSLQSRITSEAAFDEAPASLPLQRLKRGNRSPLDIMNSVQLAKFQLKDTLKERFDLFSARRGNSNSASSKLLVKQPRHSRMPGLYRDDNENILQGSTEELGGDLDDEKELTGCKRLWNIYKC
ncbi:hypothetical protein EDC01DRAFT_630650 [Geopyxis carbonaria]|nr:hypothetical protein EDC01DRAFT_630650 [Geopyxis carbonaria]